MTPTGGGTKNMKRRKTDPVAIDARRVRERLHHLVRQRVEEEIDVGRDGPRVAARPLAVFEDLEKGTEVLVALEERATQRLVGHVADPIGLQPTDEARNNTFDLVTLFSLYLAGQGAISAALTRLLPGVS